MKYRIAGFALAAFVLAVGGYTKSAAAAVASQGQTTNPAYETALERAREQVRLLNATTRASRAGFRTTTREDLDWIQDDGNYIRADDFRIDPETDRIEAVGNVKIVIRTLGTTTTVTADRLTIEERR